MEKRLGLYHGDNTETMFRGWADIWLSSQFRDWIIPAETLGKIASPVLALQGADDEYGTPEQLSRIEAGVGESARTLLIPECGHVPHDQARETVMEAALDFIAEVKPQEEEEKSESAQLPSPEAEI
jgi:pimeloyl-ACP methyl ester carboxylesterase